eukprot:2494118-Rhodomonas_salina.1
MKRATSTWKESVENPKSAAFRSAQLCAYCASTGTDAAYGATRLAVLRKREEGLSASGEEKSAGG